MGIHSSVNRVINEYIHESTLYDRESYVLVHYEPLEYDNVLNLSGTVFINENGSNKQIQTFSIHPYSQITASQEIITSPSISTYNVMCGYFVPCASCIALYWDRYPGDHFLTVSYDFNERKFVDTKSNWLLEGF